MAALHMPTLKEFPCTETGCGKSFDSSKSLGSHQRWHTMSPKARRDVSRKRLATMRLNRLETAVPEAGLATVPKAVSRPRKGATIPTAPGGGPPTFDDAVSFLEMRRDLMTDLINDLRRIRSGVYHQ